MVDPVAPQPASGDRECAALLQDAQRDLQRPEALGPSLAASRGCKVTLTLKQGMRPRRHSLLLSSLRLGVETLCGT